MYSVLLIVHQNASLAGVLTEIGHGILCHNVLSAIVGWRQRHTPRLIWYQLQLVRHHDSIIGFRSSCTNISPIARKNWKKEQKNPQYFVHGKHFSSIDLKCTKKLLIFLNRTPYNIFLQGTPFKFKNITLCLHAL